MNQIKTDILFDELIKNKDDLDLFLTLHYDFNKFYTRICVEFYDSVFLPKLKKKIAEYNDEPTNKSAGKYIEITAISQGDKILENWAGVQIGSKNYWLGNLRVYLEMVQYNCTKITSGVCEPESGKFPEQLITPLLNGLQGIGLPAKKWSDSNIGYTYSSIYQSWNPKESFLAIASEVSSSKNTTDIYSCPMAEYYISQLMALVNIVDKEVEKAKA